MGAFDIDGEKSLRFSEAKLIYTEFENFIENEQSEINFKQKWKTFKDIAGEDIKMSTEELLEVIWTDNFCGLDIVCFQREQNLEGLIIAFNHWVHKPSDTNGVCIEGL